MRDLHQKFIVTSEGFKMGRVTFHKELNMYDATVIGGGSWYWDKEKNKLHLYSESHDFGSVSATDIQNNMDDIKVIYFKDSEVIFERDSWNDLKDVLVADGYTGSQADDMISKNDFI